MGNNRKGPALNPKVVKGLETRARKTQREIGMLQGMCICIAHLIREHAFDHARSLLDSGGIEIWELKDVSEVDVKYIKPFMEEEAKKAKEKKT